MAAAELKLQVGLDLAFFRQQLAQLGTTATGYSLPINIDRLGIQKEITKLGKNISSRKYTLKITSDLTGINADINRLQKALESVGKESVNIQVTGTGNLNAKEARKIRTALRKSILSNGGKIKIPATIEAAITNDDIAKFKKLVKEKFSGIKVEIAAELKQGGASAAQQMNNLEGLFGRGKTGQAYSTNASAVGEARANVARQGLIARLEKQSLSKGGYNKPGLQQVITGLGGIPSGSSSEMRAQAIKLAKEVDNAVISKAWQTLESLQAQMKPLRGQRGIEAPRSASNINNILDPIANFTQNPGTARRMLRMLPESNISTNTLDVASRQARYYENTPSAREMQGKIKGFDPVMKAIAGDFANYTKGLSPSNPWVGKISTGIARMVSAAATSPQAQKLLPAAGQSSASRMMRSAFAGLPPIQAPSIGQENAPLSRAATYSLNKARRTLGMPIGPSSAYAPNPFAGAATVPPTAGIGGGSALPPAGTTSNYSATARRAAWAQAYQQSRPMQAPSVPPPMGGGGAPPTPPTPPSGGRGGFGSFGGIGGAMPNVSLPGAGLVRELGGEFAMAAKQVLLFGTAYKALAFLTDFPSKVGEAVGQLQTFRNTLTAVTGGGQEFGKSNQFILDLVEKYNIPLQSARDGFAKLYASMAPAGFKGDEIRDIFTGISQGAATFGMSADKVDRVNYAFAQMASKGQVMSEELKGQLGDVLPGAVAIFAEAAGFTGPEAMVKFTKAMEDGQYKGEAMKQLLLNVGVVMKKDFGPGAEGAARTFQGIMNRMQNATAKLYEAFEPMAIGFANQVVLPMTEGLKITADGFNAFFTGQKAATKGGAELASKLQELKPTFEGLANNIKSVIDRVVDLSKAFVPLLELGTKLLATPLAGFLAQTYVSVLLLNSAFTVLGGRFAVTSFVAYFSRLNSALVLTQAQMIATGGAANAMNLRILATGPAAVGATTAMGQVTLAVRAMWLAMTGPVGLAILGIAAVTAALYTMHEPSREYLNSIPARYKSFWEDLATQASASASKVQAAWQSVQSFFGQIIKNIVQIFQENIGKLPSFFQEKIVLITAIFERLMPIFGGVTQWIEANWQAMIASMINSSNPLLNIAKILGVDVGAAYVKAMAGPPPGSKNQLAPGQFTPAGGVSFDAQGKPIGASLSPFVPEVELPPIPLATGATGGKGSGADDAKRIAEQIKQQLKSAQDLKFEQQNRLTLLRAENDFTKAFTGFSIQRLEIERRYGELLEKSQSKEETAALQESRAAEYKQSRLTLQQRINELLKQAQAPLDDAVESIKNQAAFEREYGELIKNGTNPELAKQLIAIRKAYDESVKLLEPALAAAQAAVTKATAEGASATEIQKYREELERIEAIRKGLAGKKAEGEAAAQEVGKGSTPMFGDKLKAGLAAAREELAKLTDVENMLVGAANSIGEAFSSSFKGIIDGSMTAQQALAGFFQNLSNYFADMVSKMIAEWLKMQLIEGLLGLVSMFAPGFGSGIAPGPVAKSAGVKYSSTKMGPPLLTAALPMVASKPLLLEASSQAPRWAL
jgi:tape measure domain-containing protein